MAELGTPVEGKPSHDQAKESETPPLLPLLGLPQNSKLNNHGIYAENLELTHVGYVIAASISVSP